MLARRSRVWSAFWPFSATAALATAISAGCGGKLPRPTLGPHPRDAYVIVPYPPPAAVPEIVPPQPESRAVWVDGQWSYRGRYFVWERGGWVLPPEGAYFAPWTRVYGKDGTLYFAEAAWRSRAGRALPAPRVLRPAGTPPTQETPESIAEP